MDSELVAAQSSFGPLLIGVLFCACLFGVLSLQTYLYYCRKSGRLFIHLAVIIVWILNVVHLCLISHAVYYYLVTNFLNPAAHKVEVWSLSLHLAIASVITFIVQCFFVGQLWSYNVRSRLLIGNVIVLMLVRLGVGIGATIIRFDVSTFGQSHRKDVWLTICFATMLPTDVWITACMLYNIWIRRHYELQYLPFWYKVFLYVMTTGLVPCVITVTSFLLFFLQNTGLISLSIHLVLSELYTITLFSILSTSPLLSSPGNSDRVKQTGTEDSIATVKSYSKSMIQKEVETQHGSELTISSPGQKQSSHYALPSLEYRGNHDFQTFTPVHEIPMTYDEESDIKYDCSAHASVGRTKPRTSLGCSESSQQQRRPSSQNSFRTDSTVRSRTTGPSMAWESVCSSFERIGHDIGNVEWDGSDLHWEPKQ